MIQATKARYGAIGGSDLTALKANPRIPVRSVEPSSQPPCEPMKSVWVEGAECR